MTADTRIPGDYFQVAAQILATEGHRSLTIHELCGRLEVSKGSFYHHFDNLADFIERLLHDWENSFNGWWTTADNLWEPVTRFNRAFDLMADLDHRLDTAIRAWGQNDAAVGAAVARRDATLEYAYEQTASLVLRDPDRRHLVAQLGVSAYAGMQARGLIDREPVLRTLQEITRACLGITTELTHEHGKLVLRVDPESLHTALIPENQRQQLN